MTTDTTADASPGGSPGSSFVLKRELAEVFLLLDHISSNSGQQLGSAITPKDLVALCRIQWPPGPRTDTATDAALVIRAKDALNRKASPANGASIAFTYLVIADENPLLLLLWRWLRSLFRWGRDALLWLASSGRTRRDAAEVSNDSAGSAGPGGGGRGRGGPGHGDGPSQAELAAGAYPSLIAKADAFRRAVWVMSFVLLGWVMLTCAVSWYVAFGNATLTQLAGVTDALDKANAKVEQIEAGSGKTSNPDAGKASPAPADTVTPKPSVTALCDRGTVGDGGQRVFDSVGQMQACREQQQALDQVNRVRENLDGWLDCGPLHCRGLLGRLLPSPRAKTIDMAKPCPAASDCRDYAKEAYYAAILANILATSVLPVLYGFLGAGAAIVRLLSTKMEHSLLSPRDTTLAIQRLALGAVVGSCISLFVASPSDASKAAEGLLGTMALSTSALSFIAGFSVDAVFTAIQRLVNHVFNIASPTAPKT